MDPFDAIDTRSHHSAAPTVSYQTASPSAPRAPPLLPSPLATTTTTSSLSESATSSSTISFDINAPTFGCLLAATLAACLITGLTFQWVLEKGLFRKKKFLEESNQYNVIVAIAGMAALLQAIGCFVNVLLDAPSLTLSIFIMLDWVVMTHASVMIVTRKVSLTYTNAEQAWKKLLYINAGMMVVSILVCVVWIGAHHSENETFDEINQILEPLQIILWGALEFVLSGFFILQMRKYYWHVVERKGIAMLVVVAICDIGLVVLNLQMGDLITACIRGLVYALRIRLELEVLSAMVTYIQDKRKEVVYMAHEQRKKRRKAIRLKRRGSSDDIGLDDDDDSDASRRSSVSIFNNLKRRSWRRSTKKNSDSGIDLDDDDESYQSNYSLFSVFRKKRKSDNELLDDDASDASHRSHMSVFHRLPNSTDVSNIFQRGFLHDFAAATHHTSGTFFSSSIKSVRGLGRKVKNLATDTCSVASFKSSRSKKKNLGNRTIRTHTTVQGSSSLELATISGMQITVTPSEGLTKLGNESDAMIDMEDGTGPVDVSSSLHHEEGDDSEQIPPFKAEGSVSDVGLSRSCHDDSDSEGDNDDTARSDGTPQMQGSNRNQTDAPKIPIRQCSREESADETSDDGEEEANDNQPLMFGIPRSSYKIKNPSEDDEMVSIDDTPAPFGIPRSSFKVKAEIPASPTVANQGDPPAVLRRSVSWRPKKLSPPRRSKSGAGRLQAMIARKKIVSEEEEQMHAELQKSLDVEIQEALDQLKDMDCL